jgi:hypothetical protein
MSEWVQSSPGRDDDVGFVYQLVLWTSARRLGDAELAEELGRRVTKHPTTS